MALDVPVVLAAGNSAKIPVRAQIDTFPQLFASDDFPLINVGSCKPNGTKSAFSQDGPRLAIYAVGEICTCYKPGSRETHKVKGTSFSAPQVAGQIAIWLASDNPPFDTSKGQVARSVRDFIKTNPAAAFSRLGGVRGLWNGVTEANNPRFKKCTGLSGNKYIGRDSLHAAIALRHNFCDSDLTKSLSRRFYQGTMDDVVISITYDNSVPNPAPVTESSCLEYLGMELTFGCDNVNNSPDYKGGGVARVGGVTYSIEPQTVRQPASRGLEGGCTCAKHDEQTEDFELWGHGWMSSDFGDDYLQSLREACSLREDQGGNHNWQFQYGLSGDGREWTAKFRATTGNSMCIETLAANIGAPDAFECKGC